MLIELTKPTGAPVLVNTDNIVTVEESKLDQDTFCALITLSSRENFKVRQTVAEVKVLVAGGPVVTEIEVKGVAYVDAPAAQDAPEQPAADAPADELVVPDDVEDEQPAGRRRR